ncbi:MAG: acyl-CoA dehydrogenase family protein [Desulfobacterium sp.]
MNFELSKTQKEIQQAAIEFAKGEFDKMAISDTRAQESGNGSGWQLNGSKSHVVNGGMANIYLVLAKEDNLETPSLFVIDTDFESMFFQPLGRKVGINMVSIVHPNFKEELAKEAVDSCLIPTSMVQEI